MSNRKQPDVEGRVEQVLVGHEPMLYSLEDKRSAPDAAYLEKIPQPDVRVTFEGFEGDRHAGMTAVASGHTPLYPRGTEIRNSRQVSLVSTEELAQLAMDMGVPGLEPGWVGANLSLSGVPDFSALPIGTRMFFAQDTVLVVESENHPCVFPGKLIQHYNPEVPGLDRTFPKLAIHRRGVVAWVERPGMISEGDSVRIILPAPVRNRIAE